MCNRTIQGKPEEEVQKSLANLLSKDDYSFLEKGQPYFKADMLFSKARELLGFNWETESCVLNAEGDTYSLKEHLGQVVISVKLKSIIKYDDGTICNQTSELGCYELEKKKSGEGYNSIVDGIKSAQTAAKKLCLMNFINTPEKPSISQQKPASGNQTDSKQICQCKVTQAGTYLKNGMIKIPCLCNGLPKVLVIYSDVADKLTKAVNLEPAAYAASFVPGMEVTADISAEKPYGKEQQLIVTSFISIQKQQPDKKAAPDMKARTELFNVIVKGAGQINSNGTVRVPCELDGRLVYVCMNADDVKKLSGKKYTPTEFAKKFAEQKDNNWKVVGSYEERNGEHLIIKSK